MGFFQKISEPKTSVEVLAMVRHGDYTPTEEYDFRDGPLKISAITDIQSMGSQLKNYLDSLNFLVGGTTLMVTSDKERAKNTAEILRQILGIECIAFRTLGLTDSGYGYMDSAILKDLTKSLIRPNGGYQGLVVVTHKAETGSIPKLLHPKVSSNQPMLGYGNAAVYDKSGISHHIYP